MKKLFIAALIIAASATSSFAKDAANVSIKTKATFEKQFAGAQNVTWTVTENYTKASFIIAEESAEAFFTPEGQMIGISRKVDFKALPLKAIQQIRNDYPEYTVSESIEFEQESDKNYYVSLVKGNKKQILQVSTFGEVSVYNPVK